MGSEAELNTNSSSSGDSNGEFEKAQRAELEEKTRLVLRKVSQRAEAEAAGENERKRRITEDEERLLNLGDISSESKQEGTETQLQQPKPPPCSPPPPRRRRSYDPTSPEKKTEEQHQQRKAREEERRIREEENRKREKEEEQDRERALRLINEQDPESADLAHQAELAPGSSSFKELKRYRRYRERNPLQAAEDA